MRRFGKWEGLSVEWRLIFRKIESKWVARCSKTRKKNWKKKKPTSLDLRVMSKVGKGYMNGGWY